MSVSDAPDTGRRDRWRGEWGGWGTRARTGTGRLGAGAVREAERRLSDNWEKVGAVAEALRKCGTLAGDGVHKVMRGESIGRSSLADILASQRRPPPSSPAPKVDEDEGPAAAPDAPKDSLGSSSSLTPETSRPGIKFAPVPLP